MRMLPILLLLTLPLAAQHRPIQFGISVQMCFPTGDLNKETDGKVGGGMSFLMPVDLGMGNVIRPRLDFASYNISEYRHRSSDDHYQYTEKINLTSVGFGADFLFYLQGRSRFGPYLGLGVGFQTWNMSYTTSERRDHYDYWDDREDSYDSEYNKTSPNVSAMFGMQANRWFAVEMRFTTSQYKGKEGYRLGESTPNNVREVTRNGSAAQISFVFKW